MRGNQVAEQAGKKIPFELEKTLSTRRESGINIRAPGGNDTVGKVATMWGGGKIVRESEPQLTKNFWNMKGRISRRKKKDSPWSMKRVLGSCGRGKWGKNPEKSQNKW